MFSHGINIAVPSRGVDSRSDHALEPTYLSRSRSAALPRRQAVMWRGVTATVRAMVCL